MFKPIIIAGINATAKNKNIIVMGIRNKKSIAWGIAKRAYAQGANLILTYETEK